MTRSSGTKARALRPASVALAAIPLLVPALATAQNAGDPGADGPEAITVTASRATTATKTDTPIVDIPESISVVTRDRLDRQVITDSLTDILSYVPGVLAAPFGADSRVDRFTIRGFDAAAFGLYRDGLQLPSFGDPDRSFRIEPYGIETLEILRGPASVLYGNGSPGGLVNAITKRPTWTPFADVEFESGNDDRYAGKFDVGTPVGPGEQVAVRLTGLVRRSDTQVDFVHDNRVYIAPALTWAPDAATSVTILSHYQDSTTGGFAQDLPAVGTLFDSPNGQLPINRSTAEPDFDHQHNTEYSIGFILTHHFNANLYVEQEARYDHLDVHARTITGSGLDPDDPAQRLLLRSSFTGHERAASYDVDNQLHAAFDTGPVSHALLFGVEYKNYTLRDAQGSGDVASIDIFAPVYGAAVPPPPLFFDGKTQQGQTGVYAQDRITILRRLILSLGGREDFVSKSQGDMVAQTKQDSTDRRFDGNAGLLYATDVGLSPYVSYSESFLPLFGVDPQGRAFNPETGRQYEAGLKFQPRRSASFAAVDVFDLKRENMLETDPDNPNLSIQTGEQRSRGAEAEIDLSLLRRHLNIDGSFTYQDVRTTRSENGDVGKHPYTIPEDIGSLYVDYVIPGGRLAGIGIGGGLRYQGETYGDLLNTFRVPGFTVFDAALRYDWRHFRFALGAKNLFDRRYVAECSDMTACNYGNARSVVGTVRYHF